MATQPVVDPVKMPSVKADNKIIANINAVCSCFAMFFGVMALFAGISAFTKGKWSIGVPFIGTLFGANSGDVSVAFIAALASVAAAVVGLITARKITDLNAMKASWKSVRNVFVVIATIFAIDMVAIALWSLMSLGRKGYGQGSLWGSSFVGSLISVLAAGGVAFVANQIAAGKTQVLSMVRFIALGIASVALILVFIQTLVGFYAKSTKSSIYDYDDEDYSSLMNLFK